jgi:hypothetical protein
MQSIVHERELNYRISPLQNIKNLQRLQKNLILFSFVNLFIVACLGVILRSYPFINSIPFQYKNLLHGHSHFAFGGWVMPILLALILKFFPALALLIKYKHWRNIAALFMISAYGMLFSFPVQGYKAVSITFSTLSIFASFYLVIVLWKLLSNYTNSVSAKFLKAGLFYLAISAIGPFATAPIIAMGEAGTPVYYNAIYYYLHFQYNGWFTFTILAIIYKMLERNKVKTNSSLVFILFNLAVIPAFFLSVLWNQPGIIYNIIGGMAALVQVVALVYLVKDIKNFNWKWRGGESIFLLAISAFVLKIVLQLISAIPSVAVLAYQQRNITIAYLHLVLLGFVSLFAFAAIGKRYIVNYSSFTTGIKMFIFSFLTTQCLLIGFAASNIYNFTIPHYSLQLLIFSCMFPIGIGLILKSFFRFNRDKNLQVFFIKRTYSKI